jgi:hypothetical protein
MIDEINPDHPVLGKMRDHYHKLLAVVIHKYKLGEVVITSQDLINLEMSFPTGMPCILVHDKKDGIYLSIITEEEARKKGAQ